MILQNILNPTEEICDIKEMYFHEQGNRISYDTYFNIFSLDKWLEYTVLKDFSLYLKVKGKCAVEVYDVAGLLGTLEYDFQEEKEVRVPLLYRDHSRCLWFVFEKKSEDAELISGYYGTDVEPIHDVHLACDICTFRREAYVERNLKQLRESILENEDSSLYNHLDLFVIDNGRTLSKDLETDHIHLYENMNAGGTGGFTRGIIEINKKKDELGLTHMIFMDDDGILEPDALVRTYALLCYVNEKYEKSAVSGAMLREDMKYSSHEAGSHWNGTDCWTRFPGLDLRDFDNVLKNETLDTPDYAPWWFACYPLSVATLDNLPLPIFIHNDDTEYGLRNHNGFMMLNGICVWCPGFENKRSSTLSYYDVRNIILTDALYYEDGNLDAMKKYCWKRILANTLRYRYDDATLVLEAVEDFLKGPEFLASLNPEEKNMDIINRGYKLSPVEDLTNDPTVIAQINEYEEPDNVDEIYDNQIKKNKWFYALTLNGWLFPAKKDKTYAYPMGIWPYALYRKNEIILFDPDTKKGIKGKKDYKKLWRSIGYYQKIKKLLDENYTRVQKEYKDAFPYLTSYECWKKYLKLDD